MPISEGAKRALGIAGVVALLAGCSGGTQSSLSPSSGALPNARHVVGQAVHGKMSLTALKGAMKVRQGNGKSWSRVQPNNASALLYITDPGQGSVEFYTYQNGGGYTLQGQIFGFSYPAQPCTDKTGNVFIPDYGAATIYEFAHGGTTPIQTLFSAGTPTGCSVDKGTGNLAAADFGESQVEVFAGATGIPTIYPWLTTPYPEYVAYDNAGNLFIEGQSSGGGGAALGELTSGGGSITDLSLSGFSITFAGNIQFGGTYLLVGDQGNGSGPSYVNQTTVSGTTVSLHNTLTFAGSVDITGYWKRGSPPNGRITGADFGLGSAQVDKFPSMSNLATLTSGIVDPFGATVSK